MGKINPKITVWLETSENWSFSICDFNSADLKVYSINSCTIYWIIENRVREPLPIKKSGWTDHVLEFEAISMFLYISKYKIITSAGGRCREHQCKLHVLIICIFLCIINVYTFYNKLSHLWYNSQKIWNLCFSQKTQSLSLIPCSSPLTRQW